MDFEGFAPNSSIHGNIDIEFMDQLFDGGCWLQATDGSKFLQPGFTTSGELSFPSYSLQAIGINSINLASVHTQLQEHTSCNFHQRAGNDELPRSYGYKEIQSVQNSIRIAPNANLGPLLSIRERLMKAVYHFQSLTRDKGVLIQLWVPVRRGINNFLITVEQPYFHDPACSSLASYRNVSERYEFSADEGSKEKLGLPGRVFLGKAPEWTPDVRFFRQDEYPRVNYAQMCDVRGSIALPVFEKENGSCLCVVEIVTTSQKLTYRPEVETVCKALEAVDLRSSEISSHSKIPGGIEPENIELSEISHIIRSVCDKHGLPIGLTWALCSEQSKGRHWHSDKNIRCASTIESACYVRDQKVYSFHEACSEQQLFEGQGVVGKAFTTSQPCYAIDVSASSKAEYPLSHHAKMFGLRGAAAIHLQSLYGSCRSYVLEFFLPADCQDPGLTLHCKIMESLTAMVHRSHIICFSSDKEIQQVVSFSAKELSFSSDGTSWISNLVEAQRKGKEAAVSFEFGKVARDEFKVMTHWSDNKAESQRGQLFSECGNTDQEFGGDYSLGTRKAEKKRTKAQKSISLQVLRQYFAGSLKDAARSMGVCPTTLKRICRQHGITRWPSRKIKKVGHSLKKLQVVIDSVQGAEGSLQLASFYSDFPQLGPSAAKTDEQSKQINALPDTTMFSSGGTTSRSTSSSQTSSSSHSFSTGTKALSPITSNACGSGDTSLSLKRARSEAELQILSKKTFSSNLERSQSNKSIVVQTPVEILPPLPSNSKSWAQKDGAVCKVKATFGEETIRLTLTTSTSFVDLQCEVAKRFHINDVNLMHIKYLDDDKEWVLLTCDDDLEECIDIQRSSASSTVKLSVQHVTTGGFRSSLGSRVQS